tara:strand:+ start:1938 stop:3278 length:1341 start_codon:yes stop_codon:yes gene_type:complete
VKPNIIFFLIDGLRKDEIYDDEKTSKTPNFDSLITNGSFFSNAFSSADGTILSLNTIFNSLFPFNTGVRERKIILSESNFFNIFQKNGYDVYGLVPDMEIYEPIKKKFKNEINSYDWINQNESLSSGLTEKIIDVLDTDNSKPRVFYFHILDLHPLREGKIPKGLENFEDNGTSNYAKTISSIDYSFGKILERVDLSNTIIILTSDHGEKIPFEGITNSESEYKLDSAKKIGKSVLPKNTHQIAGKILSKIRTSVSKPKIVLENKPLTNYQKRSRSPYFTLSLHDENLHVPILMAGKGIPKNVIRNFVRHVDILPTICDILDFKMPKKINGVSLRPLIEGEKIEENIQYLHTMPYEKPHEDDAVGIRTSEYKYFRSSINSEKDIHLYNIQKDPYENDNIAHKNKEIVKKFEEELTRLTKDRIKFDEEVTDENNEKIEEELKKMGYL